LVDRVSQCAGTQSKCAGCRVSVQVT
jgi:hypothetical protein